MATSASDPETDSFVREQIARIDRRQAQLDLIFDELISQQHHDLAGTRAAQHSAFNSSWSLRVQLVTAALAGVASFVAGAVFYVFVLK